MSVTDADRIAAAGIPLTLGGREVRVRYTLRSWKEAEDRFGSLREVFAIMGRLSDGSEDKQVGTLIPLLWMGLLHEGMTEHEVFEAGDILLLSEYRDAILAAIDQGSSEPGRGKDAAAAVDSPGPTTTTPSPSATAAAMASSGT